MCYIVKVIWGSGLLICMVKIEREYPYPGEHCAICKALWEHKHLNKWGQIYLCDDCEKWQENRLSGKKDTRLTISEFGDEYHPAGYDWVSGELQLRHFSGYNDLILSLSHEITHIVLGDAISIKASWQYDNISKHGELDKRGNLDD